jgi:excisionase family DNA binding protein
MIKSKINHKSEDTQILSLLKEINKKLDRQQGYDKEYLSIAEAARYLACNRGIIWKLTKEGKLHQLQIGGRKYYATTELTALFQNTAHTIATKPEKVKK